MANVDLGTAHGKVVIDYDSAPLKKTKQDLDDVKSKGASTGAALKKTGDTMGVAGLAVAAGIGVAIKSASDFEKTVSGISAVTGATGDQLDAVRQKALKLGADTQFSASEAAQAMEELAKAGVGLPDILNGAADAAVALAAAGGVSLPEAATLAANAMNQFNLAAKDMPRIADLVAGAANASAIDVKDFGESLSQVGAVAHSSGLTFADTATAIAVLGQAGIKGSDAGTSLKQMLISLANPTQHAAGLMEDLGFNAFDAQGKLKPLDQIAQGLQSSMKNLTPQARNAALSIIFGSDAARAGAVFFNNGAAGVDKMAAAMTKVKAADVAKARMDNLSGSVEQLKGSLDTAMIKLGELGQGPLRSLLDSITRMINGFSNLSSGTQQTIIVMVASLGGLALFGAGLIRTVRFIQELVAVLKVLRVMTGIRAVFQAIAIGVNILNVSLLRLAANPIVLIIAAIIVAVILLAAGIYLLWKRSETFRNIVIGAWNAIKEISVDTFTLIKNVAVAAFNGIMAVIRGTTAVIMAIWRAVWPVLSTIIKVQVAIWKVEIAVVMAIIKAIIASAMAVIRGIWAVWNFLWPVVKAVWDLIVSIIRLAVAIVKLVIVAGLVVLKTVWTGFWFVLSNVVKVAWSAVTAIVRAAVNVIKTTIRAGLTVLHAIVNTVLSGIHALFNSWIGQKILAVVHFAVNTIISTFNRVVGILKTIGSTFKQAYNVVATWIGRILSKIGGIAKTIGGYFAGAGKWLYNAGKNIIVGLINGITSMIDRLRGYLNNITGWISQWKGPPAKDRVLLKPSGRMIMGGLMDGIRREVPALEKMLSGIGPGNIVASVSRSDAIETNLVGAVAKSGAAAASPAFSAPSRANSSGPTTVTVDHDGLVRAMKAAGVGDVYMDGELVSKNQSRISGRITRQRGRTS